MLLSHCWIACYGDPDVLELMNLSDPKVGPDRFRSTPARRGSTPRITRSAGVAYDALLPTHFPLASGFDVAGVVERVWPGSTAACWPTTRTHCTPPGAGRGAGQIVERQVDAATVPL
jgi:hypothetical protein